VARAKVQKEPKIVVVRMEPLLIDPREAAKLLNCSAVYVKKLLKEGELKGLKMGHRNKVTVASIYEFISRKTADSGPQRQAGPSLRDYEIPEWMEPTK
jgi:excisionase family DNA binding protein